MNILKPIQASINVPIDGTLLDVLTRKIKYLKDENEHLKLTIRHLQEESPCTALSISKEPQILNHTKLTSILRLSSYCSVASHNNQQHVICKIFENNEFEAKTFAYYLSDGMAKHATLDIMIQTLAKMHQELIFSMIDEYSKEIIK